MLLYLMNLLYEKMCLNKIEIDSSGIISDSVYISELGFVKNNNNIMTVHEKLINVVNTLNKYCLQYEEIFLIICSLLEKVCYNWILEKYNDTFYKYINLGHEEAVLHITRNLLVNNQLEMSV